MTSLVPEALSNSSINSPASPQEEFPRKLTSTRIAEMRQLVEGTCRSYKRIGEEVGVSAATVSRYAAQEGWRRPPGAALPARMGSQRDRVTQKLWRFTERHARALERQPVELSSRALQPLASLTRALGAIEKAHPRPSSGHAEGDDRALSSSPPGRTLHELRDDLVGHLQRIEREEQEYDERWGRSFEHGGGI